MLDFLPREQTVSLTLGCLVLYLIIYFMLRQAKFYPYTVPKSRYNFAVILILILCLFFFSVSDWFGYYKAFLEATKGGNTHMENVYEWLALNITQNYIIWRLIIWGGALLLLMITIRKLPVPPALCLLVFVVMMFSRFAYTRTSLAYSIMFFGCTFLYNSDDKNKKLIHSLLTFALISTAYFFHKTALFGIIMIIISYFIKKIDWKFFLLFLLFVPLLLFVLRNQISEILMMEFDTGEGGISEYMAVGQKYMERSSGGIRGISGILNDFLARGVVIIMGIVCIFQCNNINIPSIIRFFMRTTVLMVIASLLCRLNLGANTYVMYYRFLNFAVLPSVFSFSYLYSNRYYPKLLNFIYYLALLSTLFVLVYVIYVRYVNGIETYGF